MNEQQSSPTTVSTVKSTDIAGALATPSQFWNLTGIVAIGMLVLLLGVSWWTTQSQVTGLREEVAKRLHEADVSSAEAKLIAKNLQDGSKEVQSKVAVLEGKQSESMSQQLALEQLYQDLSKNRDEWTLAEIEQVLATASQQLQLAANVQGAIIALQNADARLAKSDKPQFITIRRAIGKDIERLKSLPTLDATGVALRLDSVIAQVDHLPLWADEKPIVSPTPPKAPLRVLPRSNFAKAKNKSDKNVADVIDIPESTWTTRIQDSWQSVSSEMWTELKQLIRIRQVESPDALLVAPSQAYFIRENLKLRLLNARQALLARNEDIFRNDMISAQDALSKYFDTRAKQTQTAQVLLRQVQNSNLSIEMPTLAESLNAIRTYKVKP